MRDDGTSPRSQREEPVDALELLRGIIKQRLHVARSLVERDIMLGEQWMRSNRPCHASARAMGNETGRNP